MGERVGKASAAVWLGEVLIEKAGQQGFHATPVPGVDAVADAGAVYRSFDEAQLPELFQMLRDGGLRQTNLVHDLPANAGVGPEQVLQDRHPRGMTEGLGETGDLILLVGEAIVLYGSHDYSSFNRKCTIKGGAGH